MPREIKGDDYGSLVRWCKGYFDELNRLLDAVLQAYAPADREIFSFEASKHEAARELLKRYVRYTTCVREMAKEVWPKVNLQNLLEQS